MENANETKSSLIEECRRALECCPHQSGAVGLMCVMHLEEKGIEFSVVMKDSPEKLLEEVKVCNCLKRFGKEAIIRAILLAFPEKLLAWVEERLKPISCPEVIVHVIEESMTRNMEVNMDLNELISQLNDDELERLAMVCEHGYLDWRDPMYPRRLDPSRPLCDAYLAWCCWRCRPFLVQLLGHADMARVVVAAPSERLTELIKRARRLGLAPVVFPGKPVCSFHVEGTTRDCSRALAVFNNFPPGSFSYSFGELVLPEKAMERLRLMGLLDANGIWSGRASRNALDTLKAVLVNKTQITLGELRAVLRSSSSSSSPPKSTRMPLA